MEIRIQEAAFDLNEEHEKLASNPNVGGIVAFIGHVRDINANHDVLSLQLEHYPVMAEQQITKYCNDAKARWNIIDGTVIHRVGTLYPTDPIVLVAISAVHRAEAFQACMEIMDHLKTDIPFWKKELTKEGSKWLTPN